jgi:Transposase IS4
MPNNINYEAPIEWFNLFYTPEILATITKHTNEYAAYSIIEASITLNGHGSLFTLTNYGFFLGVVIYIGIYKCPQLEDNWNSDLENTVGLFTLLYYTCHLCDLSRLSTIYVRDSINIRMGRTESAGETQSIGSLEYKNLKLKKKEKKKRGSVALRSAFK